MVSRDSPRECGCVNNTSKRWHSSPVWKAWLGVQHRIKRTWVSVCLRHSKTCGVQTNAINSIHAPMIFSSPIFAGSYSLLRPTRSLHVSRPLRTALRHSFFNYTTHSLKSMFDKPRFVNSSEKDLQPILSLLYNELCSPTILFYNVQESPIIRRHGSCRREIRREQGTKRSYEEVRGHGSVR